MTFCRALGRSKMRTSTSTSTRGFRIRTVAAKFNCFRPMAPDTIQKRKTLRSITVALGYNKLGCSAILPSQADGVPSCGNFGERLFFHALDSWMLFASFLGG